MSIPNTLLMWAVMACDNSGVVDGSSLRHVLVVGGSLDQWKSMTVAEWSEYITTLRSSVEQVGAGWLTVYPYSGIGNTGDDSEFAEKISNALRLLTCIFVLQKLKRRELLISFLQNSES